MTSAMIAGSILLIIAAAITLYAVISMIRPGFRVLANVDNRFKISYTGTTLLIIGLIIGIIGFLILIGEAAMGSAGATYGSSVAGIAVLLIYVGNILAFVIGGIRLGSKYDKGLFTAAGILFILLGLGFIGPLLMYLGFRDVLKRLGAR
ncbi:MAG: DUF973 family protein [Vulcanisaeta sp. AZ3]